MSLSGNQTSFQDDDSHTKKSINASESGEVFPSSSSFLSSICVSERYMKSAIHRAPREFYRPSLPSSHVVSSVSSSLLDLPSSGDLIEASDLASGFRDTLNPPVHPSNLNEPSPDNMRDHDIYQQSLVDGLPAPMPAHAAIDRPEPKLALVLSCFSKDFDPREISELEKKRLSDENTLVFATLRLDIESDHGLLVEDLNMLLSLSIERRDQIQTLYVLPGLSRSLDAANGKSFTLSNAIRQLGFCLSNVTRFVIQSIPRYAQFGDRFKREIAHKFQYNLTACHDRLGVMEYTMLSLFKYDYDHCNIKLVMDNISRFSNAEKLEDAIVQIDADTLSRFEGYPSVSNIRCGYVGLQKGLSVEAKVKLSEFWSYGDEQLDLSQFQNLSYLGHRGSLYSPPGVSYPLLLSLEWLLGNYLYKENVCQLDLPNLQYLRIRDVRGGCLPVYHFPKLIVLELEMVQDSTVIDFGELEFRFQRLELRRFEGIISKANNIRMATFVSDRLLSKSWQMLMSHRADRTELSIDDHIPRYHSDSLSNDEIRHLKLSNSQLKLSSFRIVNLNPFVLTETLDLVGVDIAISSTTLLSLRALNCKKGQLQFLTENDGKQTVSHFPDLKSLVIDCSTIIQKPAGGVVRTYGLDVVIKGSFYLFAPNLTVFSLSGVNNIGGLMIGSSFCPQLEVIDYHDEGSPLSLMPFSFDDPSSFYFQKLRCLSLKGSFKQKSGEKAFLNLPFPLEQLEVMNLQGSLYFPHFRKMSFRCRISCLSSSVIDAHYQGRFKASDYGKDHEKMEKVQKTIFKLMPYAEAIILDGILLKRTSNSHSSIGDSEEEDDDEVKEREEEEEEDGGPENSNNRLIGYTPSPQWDSVVSRCSLM